MESSSSTSSVLQDVNALRSLVVSVLPQLLMKLDLIGDKLEHAPTTPNTTTTMRVDISTQTEGEFVGGSPTVADDILEDGVRLEDLLWTEATLPGGIKVESSSDGGAAEGIECCEDGSADNGLQRSAGDATHGDVEQFGSCSLTQLCHVGYAGSNNTVLNTTEEEWTERSMAAEEYVIESHAPDVKPDLASTSNMSMNPTVAGSSSNQSPLQQNRVSLNKRRWNSSYRGKRFRAHSHRLHHHLSDTGEKPFKCSYCPKTFTQKCNAVEHEKIHTGKKPFKCSYCPKTFTQKCNAVEHERIHTGEKPLKCSYCPKTFSRRGSLSLHERMHNVVSHNRNHTEEKPFKCSYCLKTFKLKCNVVEHERIHTGEKPFKCSYCPKAFKQKGNVLEHERIHTGEKPFKCSYCPKTFSRRRSVRSHEQIHS